MFVIKGYSPHSHGQSDRMRAEIDFLTYAAEVAPGRTPKLIDINFENRSIIIEYISGTSFLVISIPQLRRCMRLLIFLGLSMLIYLRPKSSSVFMQPMDFYP